MATVTLTTVPFISSGVVNAYAVPSFDVDHGPPAGPVAATATVSAAGTVTFTGLLDDVTYVAYQGNPDRYLNFHVDVATIPSGALDSPEFPTFYVIPAGQGGNDSASGLSPGEAFATFAHAMTVVQAAGGGHINLGAGIVALSGSSRTELGSDNLIVQGVSGRTIFKGLAPGAQGLTIGKFGPSGEAGYTNVHLRDVVIDTTLNTQGDQSTGLLVSTVTDYSITGVIVKGGQYQLAVGGNFAPASRGYITNCTLLGSQSGQLFAPLNVEGLTFADNRLYGFGNDVSDVGGIDCEPNEVGDALRGLIISRNILRNNGGIAATYGSASDEQRLEGIEITDNQLIDCAGISIKTPRAIIRGNIMRSTQPLPTGGRAGAGFAIAISQGGDGCIVENNVCIDMNNTTTRAAVLLDGVSGCRVKDNIVRDTRLPPKASFAVEETQSVAATVSGFTAGPPSGMNIPFTAGTLQKQDGTIVNHAAQTVTIPTASAYDRVDTIYATPATGVLAVLQGTQTLDPAVLPAPANIDGTEAGVSKIPIATVAVPAGAVAVSASTIRDTRQFVVGNNIIDQPAPDRPLLYGITRLIGSGSSHVSHRRLSTRDAYKLAVLADDPLVYLPMLETAGVIAEDLGNNGEPGHYGGGVQLNKQIGATSRYGASFDGASAFAQVGRPRLLVEQALCLGSFTIEVQTMPTTTGNFDLVQQGYSTATDFALTMRSNGVIWRPTLTFGNKSGAATVAFDTTALQHITMTWDGTNLIFYKDGVADPGGAQTPGAPAYTFNDTYSYFPIALGAGVPALVPPSGNWWPGSIRHFAIYTKALSGARIAAHAAAM